MYPISFQTDAGDFSSIRVTERLRSFALPIFIKLLAHVEKQTHLYLDFSPEAYSRSLPARFFAPSGGRSSYFAFLFGPIPFLSLP